MTTASGADRSGSSPVAPVPAVLLLTGLVLVAVNLRTPLASVPPLVPTIEPALGLSGAAAGALTTLPVLCMGVFAPPAHRLAHRLGREATVGVALAVLLVGLLLRLAGSVPQLLFLGALLGGVGIAVAGTVMPGIVKEFFAERSGTVTGWYLGAMMAGATAAAALAVPLATVLGSWQASLASWSVLVVIALVVWLPLTRRVNEHAGPSVGASARGLPWRSRTAWLVAGYLTGNSLLFYSLLAWLAPAYEDLGWPAARAGLLLAVFSTLQLVAALTVPAVADRMADRRPLFAVVVGLGLVAVAVLVLAPEAAPWATVAVLGFGLGGGFTLGLVLLVDYAPAPSASAGLSAMAFLVSYSFAAAGPLLLGALRDTSGGFTVPFTVLLVVAVAQLVVVPALRPGRSVDSD